MKDFTQSLIESYTNEDDLEEVQAELKKKYPNNLILFRGWDNEIGNRGGNTNLQFPTEEEQDLNNSKAGLFFSEDADYCGEYGDIIKAYIVDRNINLFVYSDADSFIQKEHPELMNYTDENLKKLIDDEIEGCENYQDVLDEYDGCVGNESLHTAEYLSWLVLKDKYDGVKWTDVVFSTIYETEYQIWNLDKVKEIE